jgi:hypothetical protein
LNSLSISISISISQLAGGLPLELPININININISTLDRITAATQEQSGIYNPGATGAVPPWWMQHVPIF